MEDPTAPDPSKLQKNNDNHKYGPHLVLDLVGCNPKKVSDANFIYNFISSLPGVIGMNKIGNPHMDLYNGIHSEWGGWSVSVHIQESHLTFHFFDWGYVFGDIFSCKDFDTEKAIGHIMKELEANMHQPTFVDPEGEEAKKALEFLKDKKSSWNLYSRGANFPPSLK